MAQFQRLAIAPSQVRNQYIDLTAEQQHYLGRVLRLGGGDRFLAMDGRGRCWLAQLEPGLGGQASIQEEIAVQTELAVELTLLAALPKGNGFDEVVRQVTECGINCIMPVISDRTLLKPSPQKVERWRRIAIEAAEQSERQIVPTIFEPVPFSIALQNCPQKQRFICVARGNLPHLLNCLTNNFLTTQKAEKISSASSAFSSSLCVLSPNSSSIVLATGPEGGWTSEEVESAISAGFQPVSLGCRILRAVTAPLVALSIVAASLEV